MPRKSETACAHCSMSLMRATRNVMGEYITKTCQNNVVGHSYFVHTVDWS
jgi:hypothetical protein